MNIVLAPVGTRGDVQPLVALGRCLKVRGHKVVVCAPSNFEKFVMSAGLDFSIGVGDYTKFMEDIKNEPFLEVLARQSEEQFELLFSSSKGADAIVGSMLQVAGPSIAEKRLIPYFFMQPSPVFIRSDAHPPVTIENQSMGKARNRLAWEKRAHDWNVHLLPTINFWRAKLGLPKISDAQDHVLHSGHVLLACEPALFPIPAFYCPHVTVTGSWYYDYGELSPDIFEFCETGTSPIYIGFGSMLFRDPQELLEIFIEGVQRAGVRAVICSGWSRMDARSLPKSCIIVKEAPHHLLFPRMSAAIHHGGVGTVASAARAGIPQGIIPHFADQFYSGYHIHRQGLGPKPVPIDLLSAKNLFVMIRDIIEDLAMQAAARSIGEKIDPEKGLKIAAEEIEAACRKP